MIIIIKKKKGLWNISLPRINGWTWNGKVLYIVMLQCIFMENTNIHSTNGSEQFLQNEPLLF